MLVYVVLVLVLVLSGVPVAWVAMVLVIAALTGRARRRARVALGDPLVNAIDVARCPVHGLHGARADCHECGGPVDQVPMVPLSELTEQWAVATVHGDAAPVPVSHWTTDEESARSMWVALNHAAASLWSDFRYVLLSRHVSDVETVLPVDG